MDTKTKEFLRAQTKADYGNAVTKFSGSPSK